jgi:hypothetical protein
MPYNSYQALTFGLQQAATVKGQNILLTPVSAAVVPATYPITFYSNITSVFIWLQAGLTAGTVVTAMPNNSTTVFLGNGISYQQLRYNPETGKKTCGHLEKSELAHM